MIRLLSSFCLFCLLLLTAACTPMEEKRDALMGQARAHEAQGDCAEAGKAAEEALALDPALPEALLIMARCDMKADKNDSAASHFSKALEFAPDSAEALTALTRLSLLKRDAKAAGEYAQRAWDLGVRTREIKVLRAGVLMAGQNFAEARPLLEEAVSEDGTDEEAFIGLASVYINTDANDEARKLLTEGLQRFPQSQAALNLLLGLAEREKDWELADDTLQRLRSLSPGSEELVLLHAENMIRMGKEAEVQTLLTAFLGEYPAALTVRQTLINHAVNQKKFDEALRFIEEAPDTGGLKLLKANVLASAGRVDDCAALLRELTRDPAYAEQAAEIHLALAEIYLQQERFEEGGKELDAVLAHAPDNALARMMRGRLRLSQGSLAEAIADFEAILAKNENNFAAILALADAQFAAGNAPLAENLVTGVIQRKPDNTQAYLTLANLYLLQNKPEAALITLSLGKVSAREKLDLLIAEVDLLTNLQRYGEAEKLLLELAKDTKQAQGVLFRLASLYGAAKEHKKAAAVYEKILAQDANQQMAAEGRVRALIAGKQEKAALAFAEKRAKDRPKDAASAFLNAEAALAARELPKAENAYLKAHELAPQWDRPLMTLAQIYAATKRMDKALALCRDAMEKAPDAVAPGMILAMLHEQKNDPRAAEDVYRNMLAKHPDLHVAANNLAFLITRNKPTPERLAEAEKLALQASIGGQPSTLDTLGWVQHLLGKNAEAEASLRKARAGAPDNPFVAYRLAVVLAAGSQEAGKTEARDLLKPLTGKDSQFPMKKEAEALLKKLGA